MGKKNPGPLSGLTVLDFTWVLAGPHTTKTLADMGANVIKVEQYELGANERLQNLQIEKNGVTQSSYHINVNRGKQSLCINLKHPRGLEVVQGLARKSDIVIENFAPGVMDRLKLDYESIKKIKRDIIYCSISCFGHWGPNSKKPGYDVIAQAASGWTGQSASANMAPFSIGDTTAAMHACSAILAALYHRVMTGQGQNIDIALVDCLFTLHEHAFPWYWISETVGRPITMGKTGQKSPFYSPYGIYNGRDGQIAIASLTQNRWPQLVDLLGPDCQWMKTDPKAKDVASRSLPENSRVINEAIESWVMSQDSVKEAERLLEEAGIPCARVKEVVELATTDPQIEARDMKPTIFQPFLGPMHMYGTPLKFSETPASIRG
jgi:crotonobetainyl-CoA:carnitine CoA-transferase CaiB-like acyl-CoA transferase